MKRGILILLPLAFAGIVHADVLIFTGTLDPAANTNLTFWDQYAPAYAAPIAGPSDAERAFNIAVHTFSVAVAGSVNFSSIGAGLGGFDAVVSVFSGVGDSAVYLDHRYGPSPPANFGFDLVLAAGMHTVAISVFGSEPCAYGPCVSAGTFGDGFTNLANYDSAASLLYDVHVTTPTVSSVPEPSAFVLLAGVAAAIGSRRLVRRNR